MDDRLGRRDGESYDDTLVRLFENKDSLGLNCQQIADIMNKSFDLEYTESKYRKEFAAFNRGRIYERSRDQVHGRRILSISDLHVPFQHPVEVFSDYVGKVDVLQINGDVIDFSGISRFPKVYRSSPMEEIIAARDYLCGLISFLGARRVVVNYGNHDLRFQSYLAKNMDTDVLELMPRTPLELIFVDGFTHYNKKSGTKTWYEPLADVFAPAGVYIEYVDSWWTALGDTIFCHPIAFSSSPMKTASNALQWFRNEGHEFNTLVVGHTHRVGAYYVGDTVLYEQGACCKTEEMLYADGKLYNSQKQGFLYLVQDLNGNTIRDKTKQTCLN